MQGKRVIFFEMPLSRFRETGKDEMNHDGYYSRQYENPRPKTRVFFLVKPQLREPCRSTAGRAAGECKLPGRIKSAKVLVADGS